MSRSITFSTLEEAQKNFPLVKDNNYTKTIPTGSKFNELTVLYKTTSNTSRSVRYVCQCSCGKFVIVSSTNLTKELTKSCGHLKNISHYEDLSNQKFGKLTPLEAFKKNNRIYWKCQCDCGNYTEVRANHLKQGDIQSCGCTLSKGEDKIAKILLDNNITFKKHYNQTGCIFSNTNKPAYFDFCIFNDDNSIKYLIEYDGIQHFQAEDNGGWNTTENLKQVQKRDKIKNQWCINNNMPLIRIPYTHLKDLCLEDLLLETSQFIIDKGN